MTFQWAFDKLPLVPGHPNFLRKANKCISKKMQKLFLSYCDFGQGLVLGGGLSSAKG